MMNYSEKLDHCIALLGRAVEKKTRLKYALDPEKVKRIQDVLRGEPERLKADIERGDMGKAASDAEYIMNMCKKAL